MVLPLATQAQLGSCMGALALHLGSRLDAAWRAARGMPAAALRTHQTPAPHSCENFVQGSLGSSMDREAQPRLHTLPDFPSFPEPFTLPPIPRLMPSWQRLQSIAPAGAPGGGLSPGGLNQRLASGHGGDTARLAAGAGIGVAAGIGMLLLISRRGNHRARSSRF